MQLSDGDGDGDDEPHDHDHDRVQVHVQDRVHDHVHDDHDDHGELDHELHQHDKQHFQLDDASDLHEPAYLKLNIYSCSYNRSTMISFSPQKQLPSQCHHEVQHSLLYDAVSPPDAQILPLAVAKKISS